jgi:hypothetical protein
MIGTPRDVLGIIEHGVPLAGHAEERDALAHARPVEVLGFEPEEVAGYAIGLEPVEPAADGLHVLPGVRHRQSTPATVPPCGVAMTNTESVSP